jgi:hypothetical protein
MMGPPDQQPNLSDVAHQYKSHGRHLPQNQGSQTVCLERELCLCTGVQLPKRYHFRTWLRPACFL